jgi:hypothetical protein
MKKKPKISYHLPSGQPIYSIVAGQTGQEYYWGRNCKSLGMSVDEAARALYECNDHEVTKFEADDFWSGYHKS